MSTEQVRYGLFLDDYRQPSPVFRNACYALGIVDQVLVKSYDEFFEVLSVNGCPTVISFDHDLGDAHYAGDFTGPEKTGYDCAKLLVEYLVQFLEELPADFTWACHSMNPVGKQRIEDLLSEFLRRTRA